MKLHVRTAVAATLAAPLLLVTCTGCGNLRNKNLLAETAFGPITRQDAYAWLLVRRQFHLKDALVEMAKTLALYNEAVSDPSLSEKKRQVLEEMGCRSVLIKLLRKDVFEAVKVSQEKVERNLKRRPDLLYLPRRPRIRSLLVRVPKGADEETWQRAKAKAEELRRRALAGEPFEDLAKTFSDSPNRQRGGLMGAVNPMRFKEPLRSLFRTIKPGEISEPVKLESGWELFYCFGEVPERRRTREEALQIIRKNLKNLEGKRAWEAKVKSAETKVVITRLWGKEHDPVAETNVGPVWAAELSHGAGRSDLKKTDVVKVAAEKLLAEEAKALYLKDPTVKLACQWAGRWEVAKHEFQLTLEQIFNKKVAELPQVTTTKVEPLWKLRCIRLPYSGKNDAYRAWNLALDIAKRVSSSSMSFEEAAKKYSSHPTASNGGLLGWLSRLEVAGMGPAITREVFSLNPGDVSKPVQQDNAIWLFMLEGKKETTVTRKIRRGAAKLRNKIAAEIESKALARAELKILAKDEDYPPELRRKQPPRRARRARNRNRNAP